MRKLGSAAAFAVIAWSAPALSSADALAAKPFVCSNISLDENGAPATYYAFVESRLDKEALGAEFERHLRQAYASRASTGLGGCDVSQGPAEEKFHRDWVAEEEAAGRHRAIEAKFKPSR